MTMQMMERLVHRGPDDQGTTTWSKGALGHRRLSIMDPEGGRQPLWNEKGTMAIVANGEIYNFAELEEKKLTGHMFQTNSDSEAPLHLYERSNCDMAQELDGMFALIISDGESLFAARDPVGIKPLYYGKAGVSTLFASEIKALAGQASEVREFPPGTWFHSDFGFHKYRPLPQAEPEVRSVDEWSSEIRETVDRAIVKRLMSDVPLGAFLSGGLDSSIIAAVARQHMDELHTFSVGIEGSRDLEAAREVANHIDSIHHEYICIPEEICSRLPEILYHLESFDQDLVRSAVPCDFVSHLASEHVKVILTGEGADELFGGYAYYKDFSDDMPLHEELYRSVSSLYNINLQRVDRLTMARSIEGRVPFLDLSVIELGQRIPTDMKIRSLPGGQRMEKWILRKAYEDLLPPDIIWRGKEQFDQGSGFSDMLPDMAEFFMPASKMVEYMAQYPEDRIGSLEECVYHKLLCDAYAPDMKVVLANVARWKDNRLQ